MTLLKKYTLSILLFTLSIQSSYALSAAQIKNNLDLQIKKIVEKTIYELIPKDSLLNLISFSKRINYSPEKGGLQEIYLPAHSNGEESYFGATNISAKVLKSEEFEADSIDSGSGVSVTDNFDNQKYCLTVYRGNVVANPGSC